MKYDSPLLFGAHAKATNMMHVIDKWWSAVLRGCGCL